MVVRCWNKSHTVTDVLEMVNKNFTRKKKLNVSEPRYSGSALVFKCKNNSLFLSWSVQFFRERSQIVSKNCSHFLGYTASYVSVDSRRKLSKWSKDPISFLGLNMLRPSNCTKCFTFVFRWKVKYLFLSFHFRFICDRKSVLQKLDNFLYQKICENIVCTKFFTVFLI